MSVLLVAPPVPAIHCTPHPLHPSLPSIQARLRGHPRRGSHAAARHRVDGPQRSRKDKGGHRESGYSESVRIGKSRKSVRRAVLYTMVLQSTGAIVVQYWHGASTELAQHGITR